ncbi:hypothetical protein [Vibrio diabolicus]|uniref:hypothetical protein n=1 Tax=Vibrio diabolicus TaxID=50719 RepID=UPI00232AF63F|nr:hypothetical protein [Vibrio diabolicus]
MRQRLFELGKVIVFKLALLAMTLLSVQLTYTLYTEQAFVAFNGVLFMVGVHTCLTYHHQVKIWEGNSINTDSLFRGCLVALPIATISLLFYEIDVSYLAGFILYIIYKYLERVLYNYNITNSRISVAYIISISFVTVEIIIFTLFIGLSSELVSRLVLPAGLFVFILLYVVFTTMDVKRNIKNGNGNSVSGFVMHALFLVLVIMSDRFLISFVDIDDELPLKDYLLFFGYASAVYTLCSSILEVKRADLFDRAKESKNVLYYVRESGFGFFSLLCTVIFVSAYWFGYFVNEYFYTVSSYSGMYNVWMGLLIFFYFFSLLSFVQIYLLSNRIFRVLGLSWSFALLVKITPVFLGKYSYSSYLLVCVLSSILCLGFCLAANRRESDISS